ncbi:hypothetical protein BO83DRAFT_368615 [Aspergillus eucalypticola CBS 122712]|uniref:H+/nucleoside cotransporter n=1 Tax=Aspergillus eucalypticola (strain CBS 122712 / IBT 29274) TaxID=1448314 RepID=A0A317UV23_ASPEC|nr:uncharacterized protein BO83DRAFT_368615 [Aspergillus eucalypticola CBS 122712]PWY64878.1 hypothetical protein BO83DRAFT_368615 [Aspergillus eucalypticola CBS 122712]
MMADEKALAISQKTTVMSQACSNLNETAGVHAGNSEPPRGDEISSPDMKKLPTEEHQGKQNNIEEADISHTPRQQYQRCMPRYSRHVAYAGILILFTGWWVTGLVLHRDDLGWLIPFLVYLAITLRILFLYLPISVLTRPVYWIWKQTASRIVSYVPPSFRIPGAALMTIAVIMVGCFVSADTPENTRADRAVSLFGLIVFLFILWLFSRDHKNIVWHTVIVGMLVQFLVALFVLRTQAGYDIFNFISTLAQKLLGFAEQGVDFLIETGWAEKHKGWFIVSVIPAIMFFVSLVQLLYHAGILQWFVRKFATFFFWSMRVSGAEAVVAAASPFIGQGESAMLIRPFVPHLTMAEIHQTMTSGFATIAGSGLIAYIGMGVNPQALVSSCVMSIPASLAASKIRWPEKEETLTASHVTVPEDKEHQAANTLHAFANGAWMGIKIAGMITANLLCIISLVGLANGLLTWWGRYLNINNPPLTIQLIMGYICYPVSFLLGVSRDDDLLKVAQLIGMKLVMNEFIAYSALQTDPQYQTLSPRSRLIATYALCGFANIGSLGNQIGVLAQLAPERAGDVSRVALSAMITGAISTLMSAAIAGMIAI